MATQSMRVLQCVHRRHIFFCSQTKPKAHQSNILRRLNTSAFLHQTQQETNHNTSDQRNERTAKEKKFVNITWRSLVISSGMIAALYLSWKELEKEAALKKSAERVAALQEAGLGKLNWTLIDQNNKRRTYSEFRGQWLMIYFGFCHCPDICPEELEKLIDVTDGIDKTEKVPNIIPIFITLDPERDTVDYMAKYCKDFSEKLIGFTGQKEDIDATAKSYRVYYNIGEKTDDGDYIVDHTICMYLVNPEGQLMDVYQRNAQVDGIIRGSRKHMQQYEILKKRGIS